MGEQEQWQVEGSAAELYQRYLVPAITSIWAHDLVDRSELRTDDRVLDVACGTGVVTRVAAERVGPGGRVAGLDINAGMLAVARSLPPVEGASVEWHGGSALALPFAENSFDIVFCQLGLQFFPDRPAALREMFRVLVPEGKLAVNVFGPIEHNPANQAVAAAVDRHVRAGASLAKRTEHALGDLGELRALVTTSGFLNVRIQTEQRTVHFPSVADYVGMQLAATPLASVVADDVASALIADVGQALSSYVDSDGLNFPQEVHIVLASK